MRTSTILALAALATSFLILFFAYNGTRSGHLNYTPQVSSYEPLPLLLAGLIVTLVLVVGGPLLCNICSPVDDKKDSTNLKPATASGSSRMPAGAARPPRMPVNATVPSSWSAGAAMPQRMPVSATVPSSGSAGAAESSRATAFPRIESRRASGTLGLALKIFEDSDWSTKPQYIRGYEKLIDDLSVPPQKQVDLKLLKAKLREPSDGAIPEINGDFTHIDADLSVEPDLKAMFGNVSQSPVTIKVTHPLIGTEDQRIQRENIIRGFLEKCKVFTRTLMELDPTASREVNKNRLLEALDPLLFLMADVAPFAKDHRVAFDDELKLTLQMLEGSTQYLDLLKKSFFLPQEHPLNVLSSSNYSYHDKLPGELLADKRGMVVFFKQRQGMDGEKLTGGVMSFIGLYKDSKLVSVNPRFLSLPYLTHKGQFQRLSLEEKGWIHKLIWHFGRLDSTFKFKELLGRCRGLVESIDEVLLSPRALEGIVGLGEIQALNTACLARYPMRFFNENPENAFDVAVPEELRIRIKALLKYSCSVYEQSNAVKTALYEFIHIWSSGFNESLPVVGTLVPTGALTQPSFFAALGAIDDGFHQQIMLDLLDGIRACLRGLDQGDGALHGLIGNIERWIHLTRIQRHIEPTPNHPFRDIMQNLIPHIISLFRPMSVFRHARIIAINPLLDCLDKLSGTSTSPALRWDLDSFVQARVQQPNMVLRVAGALLEKGYLSEENLLKVLLTVYPQGFITYIIADAKTLNGTLLFENLEAWASPSGFLSYLPD